MAEVLALDLSLDRGAFALRVRQDLPASGITAISGPSGSGKTTLLRIVAGLEGPDAGTVRFRGETWQAGRPDGGIFVPPYRRRIGMVFQEPRLFPHLDVRRNLTYGARRANAADVDVAGVVTALDIAPLLDRPVRGLSGGEQRRVALARALAMGPQLLCLDEPLTGLDRRRRDELLPYLARAVGQAGCPTLYVSHDPAEIAALADNVLALEAGQVAGVGLQAVPDCLDLPVLSARDGLVTLDMDGTEVRVPGTARPGTLRRLHVPRDAVLASLDPPGRTGAVFAVKARACSRCDQGGAMQFTIGRHRLYAARPPTGLHNEDGRTVWLLALRADLMPERARVVAGTQARAIPQTPETAGQGD